MTTSEPVRLAITGATGRMGGELRAGAAERDDVDVVLVADHPDNLDELSPDGDEDPVTGAHVGSATELSTLLEAHAVDVLVDFTVADACVPAVEAAGVAGVAAVVGTTGLDDDQLDALREVATEAPVLKAANFARGVQALLDVVGAAAAAMEGYDAELLETHHNGKVDAPSGTAKRILRELEAARGGDEEDRVHGREGDAPREDGEVGVHAVRAGDVTGIHELVLAGNHEELRITHRAEDRGVFAAGALDAAAWLAGREAGWYEFSDVLGG